MSMLAQAYLSLTFPNMRVWSLTSLSLFLISSLFNVILALPIQSLLFLQILFRNPKLHQKWKPLHELWQIKKSILMACSNGKDHTKCLAQNGVLYASEVGSLEIMFSLHCPMALTLWCRLFWLMGIDWVLPRNVKEMLLISFRVLRDFLKVGLFSVLSTSLWFGPFGGKGTDFWE